MNRDKESQIKTEYRCVNVLLSAVGPSISQRIPVSLLSEKCWAEGGSFWLLLRYKL